MTRSKNMDAGSKSVIQINGVNSHHECGYCFAGKPNKPDVNPESESIAYGIVSTHMSAQVYEKLMLLGWRRSGTYFYKPIMDKTCCPSYTIRLHVNEFNPSKSLRKVIKSVDNYLNNKEDPKTLTMETEIASYSDEKFELYKKYQTTVHDDKPEELTPKKFTNFLVTSPLFDKESMENSTLKRSSNNILSSHNTEEKTTATVPKYGSYHQLYRLNGLLVAVGVVDILPSGVSSVYLFYHPDYKHLVLGKFSVYKEIEYSRQRFMEYYYMGFYIHTCEKMNYKGAYKPSDLLCPTTMTWQPFEQAEKLLNQFKFTPLEPSYAERYKTHILNRNSSGNNNNSKNNRNNNNNIISGEISNSEGNSNNNTVANKKTKRTEAQNDSDLIDSRDECDIHNSNNSSNSSGSEDNSEDGSDDLEEFQPQIIIPYHLSSGFHQTNQSDTAVDTVFTSATATAATATATAAKSSDVLSVETRSEALRRVAESLPMDIGAGVEVTLDMLRPQDIKVIAPLLEEWVSFSGEEINRDIIVSFC